MHTFCSLRPTCGVIVGIRLLSVLTADLHAGFADHKESIQVAYDQRQWGSHWPVDDNCPGFRDEALTFMGNCESVVHKLLECFAIGLGMPYEDFKKVTCTCVFVHCS